MKISKSRRWNQCFRTQLLSFVIAFSVGFSYVPPSTRLQTRSWKIPPTSSSSPERSLVKVSPLDDEEQDLSSRRNFMESVSKVVIAATASVPLMSTVPSNSNMANAAVSRAIGGAEAECRAAGNCLETGEWDGAVGWTWGGKDRCDAADPKCGPDGKLRDEVAAGDPVPKPTNKITQIVEVGYTIGREEAGILRVGLYGDDAPLSTTQFVQFVTQGLRTTSSLAFENGMGVESSPVCLVTGGVVGQIVPGQRLDFGIPLQSFAYARARGKAKAGDDFLPQPKPKPISESSLRPHDVAGLLSIAGKGIGYGGSGFESDDESYESSFQITAAGVPSMDQKERRRIIGQLLDEESMTNLARLASLPTKKGFKGVIPGQNSGPPLLKVTVTGVRVSAKNI